MNASAVSPNLIPLCDEKLSHFRGVRTTCVGRACGDNPDADRELAAGLEGAERSGPWNMETGVRLLFQRLDEGLAGSGAGVADEVPEEAQTSSPCEGTVSTTSEPGLVSMT